MAAWRAGIVVVAAAGNEGPAAMTIDVPGNVPYVITVGALTDNYTPYNRERRSSRLVLLRRSDLRGLRQSPSWSRPAATWSPRCRAAAISRTSIRARCCPTEQMFTMSGTSMAAAVTTGVVALMLQSDPTLTPDDVKCRLLASARPAVTSSGTLAYSVFQQGAGLINAVAAVNSSATGCANRGP